MTAPIANADGVLARGSAVAEGFTPLPNRLLDGAMPALGDTQWRVLCAVARQTLGWRSARDPRRRKGRDWLAHARLKERTGRGGDAVSRAVDSLCRQGLLIVEDAAGRPLATPEARRRHRGRLFYRLAPAFPESGIVTPETTKQTAYKRKAAASCAAAGGTSRIGE